MTAPVYSGAEFQANARVKTIPVRVPCSTQTNSALVDEQDHNRFRRFKWSLHQGRAARNVWLPDSGRRVKLFLDREILDLRAGDRRVPRHLNGNPLDCRRVNLEAVSRSLRALFNKKRATKCDDSAEDHLPPGKRSARLISTCPGVYANRQAKKLVASISYMGRRDYLGQFESEEEAQGAREDALKRILNMSASES